MRTVMLVLAAAMLAGCMTEEERLARAAAERAERERQAREARELAERLAKERAWKERCDKLAAIPGSIDVASLAETVKNANDKEMQLAAFNQLKAIALLDQQTQKALEPALRKAALGNRCFGVEVRKVRDHDNIVQHGWHKEEYEGDTLVIYRLSRKDTYYSESALDDLIREMRAKQYKAESDFINSALPGFVDSLRSDALQVLAGLAQGDDEQMALDAAKTLLAASSGTGLENARNAEVKKRLGELIKAVADGKTDLELTCDDIFRMAAAVETEEECKAFVEATRWRSNWSRISSIKTENGTTITYIRMIDEKGKTREYKRDGDFDGDAQDPSSIAAKNTAQSILAGIAKNAKFTSVRLVAIGSIFDRDALAKIQAEELDETVRTKAAERLAALKEKDENIKRLVDECKWEDALKLCEGDPCTESYAATAKKQMRLEKLVLDSETDFHDKKDALQNIRNQKFLFSLFSNGSGDLRNAAVEAIKDQELLMKIAISAKGDQSVRKAAVKAISDSKKLMEVALNDLEWLRRDAANFYGRIDLAAAFEGESEEKIVAFAMRALELVSSGYTYYYGDELEHDCACAKTAAKCVAFCASADTQAEIAAEVLDKFAQIEKRCDNIVGGSWGRDQRKEVVAELKNFLEDDGVMAKVLAKNKAGRMWIVDWASPETAAKLLLSGAIEGAAVESALAKNVAPEMITPEMYAAAKSDKAKIVLQERMPQATKNAIQHQAENRINTLLAKAEENLANTFALRGFYLGMPVEEAKELVRYYLPTSIVTITQNNAIEIDVEHGGDFDVTPMYFCRADKDGKVYQLNFDERFLKQWFKYDVQNYREWVDVYGREFDIPFQRKDVKGKYSVRNVRITVSQERYVYKNNPKGYEISLFGEKDVWDPYDDPTFSDMLGNDSRAYRAGVIVRGKAWVKNDWENDEGAREGTLRVKLLDK